jgi:hypothetical protein
MKRKRGVPLLVEKLSLLIEALISSNRPKELDGGVPGAVQDLQITDSV